MEEAWRAADRLISHLDDATIATAQKVFSRMDSIGQSRMAALHGGRRDRLEVSPNLWAGVGLVRGGAGTALVGDAQTVAQRMREYIAIGIDSFIMSGYPHLEEAYRFAELVMPLLPLDHGRTPSVVAANMGPFGETIANVARPTAVRAARSRANSTRAPNRKWRRVMISRISDGGDWASCEYRARGVASRHVPTIAWWEQQFDGFQRQGFAE